MKYRKHMMRIIVLLLLIPLAGCFKSGDFDFSRIKDIAWNPELAIPLVSSELTIMDMVKMKDDSSSLTADSQGFVTLVYKHRLYSVKPADMFTIPPVTTGNSHTFTAVEAAIINSMGTLTIPVQIDIMLSPADSVRIDSLIYGNGDLTVTISGNVNNNGSISINIPEAKKNGLPLNSTLTLEVNKINRIDLNGYKFDLTKVAGKPSTFRLIASITLTNSPAGSISAGQVMGFNIIQRTNSIKVLSGYLGRFPLVNATSTEKINIFSNALANGQFSLLDPYLKLIFTNSSGIPVDIRFSELRGTNTTTGQSLNLFGNPGLPNPLSLNGAAYNSSSPEVIVHTINNAGTGGALTEFMKIKPNIVEYTFHGLTNPKGENSENFMRDVSGLSIDAEVGLPLYGYAKNFTVQDTIDFKLDKINEVESMVIRTITDNGFPLEAKIQVYFTDANYQRLDSLVSNDLLSIPGADINLTTGQLISSTVKISDFSFPRIKINKITAAKKILVKAVLNSSGSSTQNVRIYNTYKLKVKLAVQAEIKKYI